MARIEAKTKEGALAFLQKLEALLLEDLPQAATIRNYVESELSHYKQIRATADVSGLQAPATCRSTPEAIFVDEFVINNVSSALEKFGGMDKAKAARSLLYEFYRTTEHQGISTQTCSRAPRSPFSKRTLAMTSDGVFDYWRNKGFDRASPDFRLREPFPFKILFEAKYFPPSAASPSRLLVDLIREAFLYRCLPYAFPATEKPEWDSDFACAIAYDATADGSCSKAWLSIPEEVRRSFWDGANLHVIVLRT
jgi:hypothetical protein